MFVYYFVDPNPGVEIFFKKEGATEKGDADSEIGDWGTLAHLYCVMRKIHAEPVYFVIVFFSFSFFFFFFWWQRKRIAFESCLACIFITWLLNSSELSSYSLKSRERYTLKLLLMCPEVGVRGLLEVVLPGGQTTYMREGFAWGNWVGSKRKVFLTWSFLQSYSFSQLLMLFMIQGNFMHSFFAIFC